LSSALFAYPTKAEVGKIVHKNKIYANAKLSVAAKKKFVDQVEKIVWQYKLSPESINLPAKKSVPEIEIFSITVRTQDLRDDILRIIDNAIPLPIFYEIVFDGRIKTKAALKRPSEADSNKWVTGAYFESDWQSADTERMPLPIALDLDSLYELMLRQLMPVPKIDGEDIHDQVERLTAMRRLESEIHKLESRMRKERQFNRRVELNGVLRTLKDELNDLTNYADKIPL
jgi:hypothetical protein